jgi:hypothetical protein
MFPVAPITKPGSKLRSPKKKDTVPTQTMTALVAYLPVGNEAAEKARPASRYGFLVFTIFVVIVAFVALLIRTRNAILPERTTAAVSRTSAPMAATALPAEPEGQMPPSIASNRPAKPAATSVAKKNVVKKSTAKPPSAKPFVVLNQPAPSQSHIPSQPHIPSQSNTPSANVASDNHPAESTAAMGRLRRFFGGSNIPAGKGVVQVKTKPKGATVLVSGLKMTRTTPLRFPLDPGNYTLVIQKPGFASVTRPLKVEQGQETNIDESLIQE